MSLELWMSPTPNGWKVSIMIEELRLLCSDLPEVDVHYVDLHKGEQFSEAFTAINPNQRIPALVHDGQRVFESGAILQYLAESFPSALLPSGPQRWEVLSWLYWQMANVGPAFGNKLSYTRYLVDLDEAARAHPLQRFGAEALRLADILDRQLESRPYLCGEDLTIADIAVFPWVRGWKWSKVDISGHNRLLAWVKRLRARPAFEAGLQYGVPSAEVDQWSEQRKRQYAELGSKLAADDARSTSDPREKQQASELEG